MLLTNRFARLYIICLTALLASPCVSFGQSITNVDYTINVNDSSFRNKMVEALISSNSAGTADLNIVFTQFSDTLAICNLKKVYVNSGFTNVKISPDSMDFKNGNLKNFFLATGHFPPGNYQMIATLSNANTKPIIKSFKLESDFSPKITTTETSRIVSKKNQIKLGWRIGAPKSVQKSLVYHLIIAQVSDYWDVRRPITQLKGYQWIPDISADSMQVGKLPVKLKPNKFYTYYVEAYYNDTRIGTSPKKVFMNKTAPPTNFIGRFFRKLIPAKYGDLQKLIQDTGKVSSARRPQNPLAKYLNSTSNKIKFYGSAKIETQVSDLSLPNSQIPPNYANLYLNPGVQVYDLPVVSNIFLSTENSSVYKLNSVSVNFDIQKYKENQLSAFKMQNLDLGNLSQYSEVEKKGLVVQKDLLTKQISSLETDIDKKESALEKTKPPAENMTQRENQLMDTLKKDAGSFKRPRGSKTQTADSAAKDSSSLKPQNTGKAQMDSAAKIQKSMSKDEKNIQDSLKKDKRIASNLDKKADSLQKINPNSATSLVTKNKSLDSSKNQLNILKQRLATIEAALDRFQKQANGLEEPNQKDIFADFEKYMPGNKVLNKVVSVVDHFNIGRSYPYFSDLSLSGIAVNGCNAGLSYKNVYLDAVAGNSLTYNFNLPQSKNFISAIKAGFGKEAGDHIALSFVNVAPAGGGAFLKNQILTGEIQYILFKNFKVTGGLNESFTSGGTPDELPLSQKLSGLSDILQNNHNLAYSVKAQYDIPVLKSKLQFSYDAIESGYMSEAAPFLRTGTAEYAVNYDQALFKRTVTLSAFYRTYSDSLSKPASSVTTFKSYGLSGNIKIKHLPIITFSISPYKQTSISKTDSTNNNNTTNSIMGNLSMSYTLKISGISFSTTASCTKIGVSNSILNYAYNSSTYSLLEQASFKGGSFISLGASIIKAPEGQNSFADYHAGIGTIIHNKWSNSITGDFDVSDSATMNKFVLAWQTSYAVSKQFSLQLRAGENFLNNIEQPGYSKQYFFNTSLIFTFK